ncbi:MAG: protein-disulfide reductase DsbD [Gammaproteobacteria bacterium]
MFNVKLIFLVFVALFGGSALALQSSELLPPEQAFKLSAIAASAEEVLVTWEIAEGVHVYRDKIKFASDTPEIELQEVRLPAGVVKHDPAFGDVEVYHGKVGVAVPLRRLKPAAAVAIAVRYHGCSDLGVCYPPQKAVLNVALPVVDGDDAIDRLARGLQGLQQNLFGDELLPPEEAFRFFAEVKDGNTLRVNWQIAGGYYLYREKIQLMLSAGENVQLGKFTVPHGEPKVDAEFGNVEVFHRELSFDVPLLRSAGEAQNVTLQAQYQGCADRGVCYPPMQSEAVLSLPPALQTVPLGEQHSAVVPPPVMSEQDQIVQALHHESFALTLLSFFGFGLLLAFTPCIFPMIPILSGIIVGQGKNIGTRRAFLLSLSYVLASAATYTVFGVLAALFGSNLQATFQSPWIIAAFSGVFVLLALSMFGFYNLELPKALQSYLHNSSDKHRDGTLIGAGLMGVFSSLIVGPCVAAPLAAALIYIGQTGDVLLGAGALFMMGFGMGVPLLLLGASAGKLLPKAGHWLYATKAVFGVIMLAIAVWMLQRIVPPAVTMLLWALLLIIPSIYLGALEPLPVPASGWYKFRKGSGQVLFVSGVLLLIGLGMGNTNPLKPLQGALLDVADAAVEQRRPIAFQRVVSVDDLQTKLQQASDRKQWVMLDFYADWCVSCQEMEAYTFNDPRVKEKLAQFVVLQADVTQNSAADQALLKRFNLVGPPATLFFAPDQQERREYRVIGYQDAETFLKHLPQPETDI